MDLKLSMILIACATSLEAMQSNFHRSDNIVPNQIIAQPLPEVDSQTFLSLVEQCPFLSVKRSSEFGQNRLYLLEIDETMLESELKNYTEANAASELQKYIEDYFGSVLNVAGYNVIAEPASAPGYLAGYDCSSNRNEMCNEAFLSEYLWDLGRISQVERLSSDATYFRYTWSDSNDGNGVLIYILDSGVNAQHSEFSDINVEHAYTIGEFRDSEGSDDLHGHGTFVASKAVGKTVGVAKRATIISVKCANATGNSDFFGIYEALSYIVDDVTNRSQQGDVKVVVNLSLGLWVPTPGIDEVVLNVTRQGYEELGILWVAAAGNSAADACDLTPAQSPYVIAVGATDKTDTVWDLSNRGVCVDILAPGVNVFGAINNDTMPYGATHGTSLSSPLVAGVIARHLSDARDGYDVTCVKQHLIDTAIYGRATIPDYYRTPGHSLPDPGTPNLMLYAGCNTCFGDRTCSPDERFGSATVTKGDNNQCINLAILVFSYLYAVY